MRSSKGNKRKICRTEQVFKKLLSSFIFSYIFKRGQLHKLKTSLKYYVKCNHYEIFRTYAEFTSDSSLRESQFITRYH